MAPKVPVKSATLSGDPACGARGMQVKWCFVVFVYAIVCGDHACRGRGTQVRLRFAVFFMEPSAECVESGKDRAH